jgi:hypothetical protein
MAAARQKLARVLLAARLSDGIQESVRIKWFERFINATHEDKLLPTTALDFYLAILQQLIPADRLVSRLVDEPYHACVISNSTMRSLVDHKLVSRLLETKDQRRRLLLLQTSTDNDSSNFVATTGGSPPSKGKMKSMEVLHIDDVLDAIMTLWMRYQQRYESADFQRCGGLTLRLTRNVASRVQDEWTATFQRMAPDGSGVVHMNGASRMRRKERQVASLFGGHGLSGLLCFALVVKTAVRTKMPALDDRAITKVYHSCGQENQLGEHALHAVRSCLSTLAAGDLPTGLADAEPARDSFNECRC